MNPFFNPNQLVKNGTKALKLVAETYENFENIKVFPSIKPGFLRSQLPDAPPMKGEDFDEILKDTKNLLIPNMTHWQHPKFFGYFPSVIAHDSVIAEIIANSFNSPGFTWVCSPVHTELENIIMDWSVKMLNLPEKFLLKSKGGGMIANTVGDAIFLSVNAAKYRKMKELNLDHTNPDILKFVGYYSEHAHPQNLKALVIKDIPYKRALPVKYCAIAQNFVLDMEKFKYLLEEDLNNKLIPFWFGAALGTTSTCAVDCLDEIVALCEKHKIWVNVDAAFLGSTFVCPEYKKLYGNGLDGVDSLTINFSKLLLSGMNSALFYVSDKLLYNESLSGKSAALYINPEFLKNQYSNDLDVVDYKDWQIGLGRRFSSLKMWFMIRSHGIEGLQNHIRSGVKLGELFESYIKEDKRFEMVTKREVSLICFRAIKYANNENIHPEKLNEVNKTLYEKVNNSGEFLIVGTEANKIYFLRFVAGNPNTELKHVEAFWRHLLACHEELI